MNYKVIDGHSHIGYETEEEVVGKNIMMPYLPTINEYEKIAKKNNIGISLVAPCTSPMIIDKERSVTKVFCLWKYVNNKFEYYSEIVDNGRIKILDVQSNPYKEVNEKLMNYLKNVETVVDFKYIPAINLYFDTVDYLEELLSYNPKGLKVHGISTGLYDLDIINPDLLKVISKSNVPLAVHTDYCDNISSGIDKLYFANNPLNWIKLLSKYDIRGYLIHGCRLSKECSYILKQNKGQFLAGISPDLLLNNEPERLMKNTDNYLRDLLNLYDEDTLSFDIDYNWNYTDRITYTGDYNQLNRFCEYVSDETSKKKILHDNSKKFFRL